jgi:hypothetical protein
MNSNPPSPNPKKVAAGKLNRAKRGPLTPEGREALRQAALANRPWDASTGPRTPEGKARAARNCKVLQKGASSVRERRAELAGVAGLLADMRTCRRIAAGLAGEAGGGAD